MGGLRHDVGCYITSYDLYIAAQYFNNPVFPMRATGCAIAHLNAHSNNFKRDLTVPEQLAALRTERDEAKVQLAVALDDNRGLRHHLQDAMTQIERMSDREHEALAERDEALHDLGEFQEWMHDAYENDDVDARYIAMREDRDSLYADRQKALQKLAELERGSHAVICEHCDREEYLHVGYCSACWSTLASEKKAEAMHAALGGQTLVDDLREKLAAAHAEIVSLELAVQRKNEDYDTGVREAREANKLEIAKAEATIAALGELRERVEHMADRDNPVYIHASQAVWIDRLDVRNVLKQISKELLLGTPNVTALITADQERREKAAKWDAANNNMSVVLTADQYEQAQRDAETVARVALWAKLRATSRSHPEYAAAVHDVQALLDGPQPAGEEATK